MTFEYTKAITVEDFSRICRTCFSEENVCPISEVMIGEVKATDLVNLSVSLEIDDQDELPQNVCLECLKKLYQYYEFKKQCQDNEAVLKYVLQNSYDRREVDKDSKNFIYAGDGGETTNNDDGLCSDPTPKSEESNDAAVSNDKKSRFKCLDCNEVMADHEALLKHRKEMKHFLLKNRSYYSCEICGKQFTKSKLKQHMRSHTKEKPYICDICGSSFSLSGNLRRHKMTHTGERPHVCEVCGKGFIQSTTLQGHLKTHTSGDGRRARSSKDYVSLETGLLIHRYNCNICGRGFRRSNAYNAHLDRHMSEGTNLNVEKIPREEKLTETADMCVCNICGKLKKNRYSLKAHLMTHGEKSFLCSACGKGFTSKAALRSHSKTHTGEKPHQCLVCKKSFAHIGSFESHMLIHTGIRPYHCKFCPKRFTQLSHLKYHSRTHSGERPYACTFCGKTFALKGNLTVHTRTHTGETPYVCKVCGKGFYDSSSMKKHRNNHHKKEMLENSDCAGGKEPEYAEAMKENEYQIDAGRTNDYEVPDAEKVEGYEVSAVVSDEFNGIIAYQ